MVPRAECVLVGRGNTVLNCVLSLGNADSSCRNKKALKSIWQLEERHLNEGSRIEAATEGRAESCQKVSGKLNF